MGMAYIGMGSNVGDRRQHLEFARAALAALPGSELLGMSPIHETAPVGPVAQGLFLNAVAALRTELPPVPLLRALLDIEAQAGRQPPGHRVKWGPRTLDLDVLLYDELVLDDPELILPHPLMHERRFVLAPLCDLAPQAWHPVLQATAADLLARL